MPNPARPPVLEWEEHLMRDVIAASALILGSLLILAQIFVSIWKATHPTPSPKQDDATGLTVVSAAIEKIGDHVPLAVAGIVLLLIAAVVSGDLAASVVFGDPSKADGTP